MGKRNTLFFWLGGVLTQTILETTIETLSSQPGTGIRFQKRLLIQALSEDLSLGRVDEHEFCKRTAELIGLEMPADELETRIKKNVSVRNPVLEVIQRLPEAYQTWLISDYPPEWYQSAADRFNLRAYFPEERVIFTPCAQLHRLDPDIFYYVAHKANQPFDACLIVDGLSARAVHAVRHGLSSTIYVDPTRLNRDFILRGLLPALNFRIHPGTL